MTTRVGAVEWEGQWPLWVPPTAASLWSVWFGSKPTSRYWTGQGVYVYVIGHRNGTYEVVHLVAGAKLARVSGTYLSASREDALARAKDAKNDGRIQ